MDQAYIEKFIDGYEECALWSELTEDGDPLDETCSYEDISDVCKAEMRRDCEKFCNENAKLLEEAEKLGRPAEYCGHDFWLTRNHHGTGFWDRDLGDVGDKLDKACEAYGNANLYIGDDGKVYHF